MFRLLLLLFSCSFLPSCGEDKGSHTQAEPPLYIAVAANARYAAEALVTAFEQQSGQSVELISSSSGKLAAQIREGAPYGVFLSADMDYPEALSRAGLSADAPGVYGHGQLVVWSSRYPVDSAALATQMLRTPGKIALANPALAPYGRAALEWLKQAGIYEQVGSRLVYGESIAQVNQFVLSEAAAFGFTALAVVLAPEQANRGYYYPLPTDTYAPIEQGMIITRYGAERQPDASQAFYDFVRSPAGRELLRQYGYE